MEFLRRLWSLITPRRTPTLSGKAFCNITVDESKFTIEMNEAADRMAKFAQQVQAVGEPEHDDSTSDPGADTVPFLPAIQTGYDHHTLAESVQRQAIRDVCDVIAANHPPASAPQKAVQDAQRRGGICHSPGGCKHPPRAYEGQ